MLARQRDLHQWLADHPRQSEQDFADTVWPQLREQYKMQLAEQASVLLQARIAKRKDRTHERKVDPYSPEAVLQRAQENHDRVWNDWFRTRSQHDEERLDKATAELERARQNVAENNAARKVRLHARKLQPVRSKPKTTRSSKRRLPPLSSASSENG